MKDKDFDAPFPWTLAFIVCSLSFFGFTRVMKFLNISLPPLFLWISIVALAVGCFSALISLVSKKRKYTRPEYVTNSQELD